MARPVTFQTLIEDTRRWANIRTSTPDDAHQTDSDVARILELKLAELHEMLTSSTASAFVETEADVSIVNGAGDLPEDFFRLNAAWVVWSSSDHEPLTNLSNQQYAASYAGSSWTAGASKAFRIVGGQLRVFPAATSATVRIAYVPAFATADEYDGVNGWEKYVTVGAAIEILAIENRTNAALEREYERQSERILSMIEERQAQDPPRIRDASCPEPARSCGGGGAGGGGGGSSPAPVSVAASAVTYSPTVAGLRSTNSQGALDELGGYATMAELRAVAPINGKQARTRSYDTLGDGGGGQWRGVVTVPLAPGTYTHNGGTVLVPFSGDGSAAWVRDYNGPVFPEWFGAKGDGTTDDTAAIQAALDSSGEAGVQLRPAVYRTVATLTITSSVQLTGAGYAESVVAIDASNVDILRCTSSSNGVRIDNITWRGNQTGTGGLVSDSSGGHGIALDSASNVLIRGCRFENIGVTSPVHGNYASPICGTGVDAVSVEGCFFAESNRNRTGADIQLSGANISVQNGNRSVSYCDAFVNLGAEGTAIRHIVTGNFAYRAPDAISRSGVLYQYDAGSPAFADISHNQIEGFGWHGVYGTAEAAADGGGVIVAHNTIRYCGGLDDLAVPQNWPGSAVSPHGPAGAIVEGNYVYAMGYTSDGSPRDTPCSGILLVAGGEFEVANVTLRGNRIHGSSGPGIALLAQGTSSIRNIDIDGNIITDCLGVGINVAAQATAVECITDVKIRGNQVRVGVDAVSGISIGGSNGGWANRIHVQSDNDVRYTGGGTSSATGIARAGHSTLGRFTGSISGNYVSGFATGITVGGTIALYVPLAVPIDGNVIENCTTSIDPGATDFQVFDPSNVSRGHTNAYVNRGRPGRLLSVAGSARPLVELISSGLPTAGAWLAGDRVLLQTRRGPLIGYQCTGAGTPGVWTPIYEEIGFGTKIFVAPAFGTTALDSRGLESTAEVVGAATSRSWDTNRVYTRTPLVEYLDTSAGTDSIAGVRSDSAIFARSAFYTKLIWGPATGMAVGTRRAFAGLISSTSAPTDVDPSTLTNIIGMGWDDDDTQVQVMYNDDSGTATRVALGASFPRPVDDRTTLYALEVYVASSSALPIISVTNLVTGARATDVFASLDNCPAGDTPLCPYSVWASVGGTSGVAGVAFGGFEGWRVN